MKKNNSLLKTQMFQDGTTPAISLNPVLPAGRFEVMSYQTWVKNNFYQKPRGLTYKQLLRAKDFYECDRICFYYTQDYKSRKEAVCKWITEDKNYDGIIEHNGYTKIVFYNPYNDARTYVYLGK